MTTQPPQSSLLPLRNQQLVLESPVLNRGMQILKEIEPVPVFPAAVLQLKDLLIIIEEPQTTICGGNFEMEYLNYRVFFVHIFDTNSGEYRRSFQCRLANLIGRREENGKPSYRDYKLNQDKLLVHETLYHGMGFAEHVFDLYGTLLCILTDDKELERRNPEIDVRVVAVPVGDSQYWTVSLKHGWKGGRFRDVKWGHRYFGSRAEGYRLIFYDIDALLRKINLLEPHTDNWPTLFDVTTLGAWDSVIPDNEGIWIHKSRQVIQFIPANLEGIAIPEALEREINAEDPPLMIAGERGGSSEILFVEFTPLDMQQENIDKLTGNHHIYTYCWVNNGELSIMRGIDLYEQFREQTGISSDDIQSIQDLSIREAVVACSISLSPEHDQYRDGFIMTLHLKSGESASFVPMVPRHKAAEGSYPTLVETDEYGTILLMLPEIHSQFQRKNETLHLGQIMANRIKPPKSS